MQRYTFFIEQTNSLCLLSTFPLSICVSLVAFYYFINVSVVRGSHRDRTARENLGSLSEFYHAHSGFYIFFFISLILLLFYDHYRYRFLSASVSLAVCDHLEFIFPATVAGIGTTLFKLIVKNSNDCYETVSDVNIGNLKRVACVNRLPKSFTPAGKFPKKIVILLGNLPGNVYLCTHLLIQIKKK